MATAASGQAVGGCIIVLLINGQRIVGLYLGIRAELRLSLEGNEEEGIVAQQINPLILRLFTVIATFHSLFSFHH